MNGIKTPLDLAAAAVELVEGAGLTAAEAARRTGLSIRTVQEICAEVRGEVGQGYGWGEIAQGPIFQEHRRRQSQYLEVYARDLARKSWSHAEAKLPDASYSQAVLGGAILVDKARLLAGESTSNISTHITHEAGASLDALLTRLATILGETGKDTNLPEIAQTGASSEAKPKP